MNKVFLYSILLFSIFHSGLSQAGQASSSAAAKREAISYEPHYGLKVGDVVKGIASSGAFTAAVTHFETTHQMVYLRTATRENAPPTALIDDLFLPIFPKSSYGMPLHAQLPALSLQSLEESERGQYAKQLGVRYITDGSIVRAPGEPRTFKDAPVYFRNHAQEIEKGKSYLWIPRNVSDLSRSVPVKAVGIIEYLDYYNFVHRYDVMETENDALFPKGTLIEANFEDLFYVDPSATQSQWNPGDELSDGPESNVVCTVVNRNLVDLELIIQSPQGLKRGYANFFQRIRTTHLQHPWKPGDRLKDRGGREYTFLFYYVNKINYITGARVLYTDPYSPENTQGHTMQLEELSLAPASADETILNCK